MKFLQLLNCDQPNPPPPRPPLLPRQPPQSPRRELIKRIDRIDGEAQKACINFLQEQYPSISPEQVEKLIDLIFDNNFTTSLPNHFGRFGPEDFTYGFPYIWLLNELEAGGIQYLYRNKIWQIHWDTSYRPYGKSHPSRFYPAKDPMIIKYLLTSGPAIEEEKQFLKEFGLVFFSYWGGASDWQDYPFSEEVDLSCDDPYLSQLRAP